MRETLNKAIRMLNAKLNEIENEKKKRVQRTKEERKRERNNKIHFCFMKIENLLGTHCSHSHTNVSHRLHDIRIPCEQSFTIHATIVKSEKNVEN